MSGGRIEWIGVAAKRKAPIVAVETATLVAGEGIEGDRRVGVRNRHVTLIQWEDLGKIARDHGREQAIDPALTRRNIAVSGLELMNFMDKELRIGSAVVRITDTCDPCERMDGTLGPGGMKAMENRGGVTAVVVSGGAIRVGDTVRRVMRFGWAEIAVLVTIAGVVVWTLITRADEQEPASPAPPVSEPVADAAVPAITPKARAAVAAAATERPKPYLEMPEFVPLVERTGESQRVWQNIRARLEQKLGDKADAMVQYLEDRCGEIHAVAAAGLATKTEEGVFEDLVTHSMYDVFEKAREPGSGWEEVSAVALPYLYTCLYEFPRLRAPFRKVLLRDPVANELGIREPRQR